MAESTLTTDTFAIERTYPAAVERVSPISPTRP